MKPSQINHLTASHLVSLDNKNTSSTKKARRAVNLKKSLGNKDDKNSPQSKIPLLYQSEDHTVVTQPSQLTKLINPPKLKILLPRKSQAYKILRRPS